MSTMASTTTTRVGQDLRAAREQAGLSRERLARLADCSVDWIKQLERDLPVSPALDRIWRVLDALDDRPSGGGA
jgi:transcriptional regulator with XRE-family HTH domain